MSFNHVVGGHTKMNKQNYFPQDCLVGSAGSERA